MESYRGRQGETELRVQKRERMVGGGGSGEFKVGEDRDGERKGEQEWERGAEY